MELNPGYKHTEVGAIPEDWEISLISDIALTSSGTTPARASSDRYFKNGSIPWVKTLDLNNAEIIKTEECVTKIALTETSLKLFPLGTVLVAMYGGYVQIGRTGLLRVAATVNQAITAIIPENKKLHSVYLLYVLNYRVNYWKLVASSSRKDPNITGNDVKAFPIALPSFSEQQAIATAISDIDALLYSLSKLITKKRDIKQATMQQLLTGETRLPGFNQKWEIKLLGYIAEIIMGQSPSSANYNSTGKGLPLIQGNADISNRETIRRIYTTQTTKKGNNGDILMSVRAPVGEISRAVFDACLGRGVCAIRFPNDFLYHYLIFIESHWIKHSKGSTFDSVNSTDIKAVEIYMPTQPEEQTAIAQAISDIDKEITALEKRLEKTRMLKQGMMQELLTGRIRLA